VPVPAPALSGSIPHSPPLSAAARPLGKIAAWRALSSLRGEVAGNRVLRSTLIDGVELVVDSARQNDRRPAGMADEWTREGMEGRRPSCFDFFLDVCENGEAVAPPPWPALPWASLTLARGVRAAGDACNYSHAPLFTASLKGIPHSGATKESVTEGGDRCGEVWNTGSPYKDDDARRQHPDGKYGVRALMTWIRAELAAFKPVHVAFTGKACSSTCCV